MTGSVSHLVFYAPIVFGMELEVVHNSKTPYNIDVIKKMELLKALI